MTMNNTCPHNYHFNRRKKKCVKRKDDLERDELDVSDITKNSKVTSILGTLGQESIQDSTYVTTECREDVIVSSQTSQSESTSIIQAPITLQTIPT